MELTWINKLRIAAVAALGVVLIGILAWPLAAPTDPLLPVRASNVSLLGTALLLVLALTIGFVGYFIAWPNGREIAILGVPFGLTIWAGRSGPMRALTQSLDEPAERAALVHSLLAEPIYWLVLVAAGFAGVLLAQHLHPAPQQPAQDESPSRRASANVYVNGGLALVVAILVSQFFIGVFGQNLEMSRNAVAQPAVGQIIFAVTAAFALAAFAVKRFFDLTYLLPAAASLFVIGFAAAFYYRAATIERFAETYPATSFPHSIFAITPVQLVALGTLGAVIGFWMAVRYDWWRKHETA